MQPSAQPEILPRVGTCQMPTKWGTFQAIGFERDLSNGSGRTETALALVLGDVTGDAPLLRIHSQCFTGELVGSLRCDCRDQFEIAMQAIADEGRGLLIYEYQEGRGIGLMAKLQAYALQDAGFDTVEANHALGFEADYRDFSLPAAILSDLGVSRVRLLTNNLQKSRVLAEAGIQVLAQIPCQGAPTRDSLPYLRTKKEKMGHALNVGPGDDGGEICHHSGYSVAPEDFRFASVEEAVRELRAGRMIVVVDDEDRENEGDLTMAAEMITPEAINFMAMHGRGLICLAMTGERIEQLKLSPMTTENSALAGTAFTVSIDANSPGMTTGISARDRAQTIKAAIDESSGPEDFARPGHIFPLRTRAGGVLERRGQTEAAVDLARLAGLHSSGVICEIINDDGTMARLPDLTRFCRKHRLVMITVSELARYRMDLLDDHGIIEALEGLIPASSRLSAPKIRRWEPGDAYQAGVARLSV
jgi:3,4-dihydroxy-2-butanone 4-phosphate synthase/GTP cyclohydrolase II